MNDAGPILAILIFAVIFFAIIIAIIRWVLRVNEIVDILTRIEASVRSNSGAVMVDPLADCESCGRRLPAHRMHRIGSGHLLCDECYAQLAGVTASENPPKGSTGPTGASADLPKTH